MVDAKSQTIFRFERPNVEEHFLPAELVVACANATTKPGLPCHKFCMDKWKVAPGTYLPPGFPVMNDEARMKAVVWANNAFFGLPSHVSHNLYAGFYTWGEIKKAYKLACLSFSPATQCLCMLAMNFSDYLPKEPHKSGAMPVKFLKD